MALYYEEEKNRIICPCGWKLFHEKPVYSYIKANGHIVRATLEKTQFICEKCKTIAFEIKADGKTTILR